MSDPYRSASTESCPLCGLPLLAAGDDRVRRCPAACGEWVSTAAMARRWGPVPRGQEDPREGWRAGQNRACVVCGGETRRFVGDGWMMHRCEAHGGWFDKRQRARFEAAWSSAIEAHEREIAARERQADERERDAAMREAFHDLLRRARDGDDEALRAFGERFLALERAVYRR